MNDKRLGKLVCRKKDVRTFLKIKQYWIEEGLLFLDTVSMFRILSEKIKNKILKQGVNENT